GYCATDARSCATAPRAATNSATKKPLTLTRIGVQACRNARREQVSDWKARGIVCVLAAFAVRASAQQPANESVPLAALCAPDATAGSPTERTILSLMLVRSEPGAVLLPLG